MFFRIGRSARAACFGRKVRPLGARECPRNARSGLGSLRSSPRFFRSLVEKDSHLTKTFRHGCSPGQGVRGWMGHFLLFLRNLVFFLQKGDLLGYVFSSIISRTIPIHFERVKSPVKKTPIHFERGSSVKRSPFRIFSNSPFILNGKNSLFILNGEIPSHFELGNLNSL